MSPEAPQRPILPAGWVAALRDHGALLLTLGYLGLTAVGVSYETLLLLRFRTSYLAFADSADFLVAALRNPVVLMFTLASGAALWFVHAIDRPLRRWIPAYGRSMARWETPGWVRFNRLLVYPLFVIVYFTYFTVLHARQTAERIRSGVVPAVRLEPAGGGAPLVGPLVTTTSRFVFLWVPADSALHVVAVENLSEIVVRRGRAR